MNRPQSSGLFRMECVPRIHGDEPMQNTTLDVEADVFDLEAVYRNTSKQNNVSTDLTNKLWVQIAAKNS